MQIGEFLGSVKPQLWGPTGLDYLSKLFNIYMRLLGGVIRGCGVSCHQYADDTQLYISFFPTTVDAVSSLEHCLGAVQQSMQENGLRLNPGKMGAPDISGLGNSLSWGCVTLTTKSEVCSLGVHLDLALTMETQVLSVVHSAHFHL